MAAAASIHTNLRQTVACSRMEPLNSAAAGTADERLQIVLPSSYRKLQVFVRLQVGVSSACCCFAVSARDLRVFSPAVLPYPRIPSNVLLRSRARFTSELLHIRQTLPGYAQVWRRLLVPATFDLSDTHTLLQHALGWLSGHLFAFHSPATGMLYSPEPSAFPHHVAQQLEDVQHVQLADLLPSTGACASYLYDFESRWIHDLTLEREVESYSPLPEAVDGSGVGPAEGSGGALGWSFVEALLTGRGVGWEEALTEPEDMLEWLACQQCRLPLPPQLLGGISGGGSDFWPPLMGRGGAEPEPAAAAAAPPLQQQQQQQQQNADAATEAASAAAVSTAAMPMPLSGHQSEEEEDVITETEFKGQPPLLTLVSAAATAAGAVVSPEAFEHFDAEAVNILLHHVFNNTTGPMRPPDIIGSSNTLRGTAATGLDESSE